MGRIATCLFPGLSGANAGGVQSSGRVAWQAVARHARAAGGSAALLVYGEAEDDDLSLADGGRFVAGSRLGALGGASWRDWRAALVCIWHVDLLRLLPFLRVGRAKIVLFLHGIEVWRRLGRAQRRLLERVHLFLSNSEFTWRRFVEFHPECRERSHQIVPLGCEDALPGAALPPDQAPAALVLGRMARGEDYKGHRELIAAWPLVLARLPEAQLWIAGDGDLRPELERAAASAGLDGCVRFWGRAPEDRKQELLQRCRGLAMPSRGEGFGLVYLEAMRLGRPCLVSTSDAGREVVAPPIAGLAVDPLDSAALAAALCRLLADGPEWQTWSRSARERYEDRFTARHFQHRLVEALFGPKTTRTA